MSMPEQFNYCFKECPVARQKQASLLVDCASVFDAAEGLADFFKACIKTCPHKNKKEEE